MSDQCALGARPRATKHESCARMHATQPDSCTPGGATEQTRATDRSSSARAEASRRNGAKSRGPKTAAGKARSAQNALKHGLRGHRLVLLADEDATEFQALEDTLRAELAPEGALQQLLVARITSAAWRMLRADRIEIELFHWHAGHEAQGLGLALIRDGHGPRAFATLLRYRGAVQTEFWRLLRALSALKAEAAVSIELPAAAAPRSQAERSGPAEPVPATGWLSRNKSEPGCNPNQPERRDVAREPPARCDSDQLRATPDAPRGRGVPERRESPCRAQGTGIQTNPNLAEIDARRTDGARFANRSSG